MSMVLNKISAAKNYSIKAYRKVRWLMDDRRNYMFNIESPRSRIVKGDTLIIEGWIFRTDDKIFEINIYVDDEKCDNVKTGLVRNDVAKGFINKNYSQEKLSRSGFSVELKNFSKGNVAIKVCEPGSKENLIFEMKTIRKEYGLVEDIINPDLAENFAEHQNLLSDNKAYYHEPEAKSSFARDKNDPRVVAIYLPQFHPFPENDIAWGKGFTEWTNVSAATPRFIGQQQPILPADLGFYDLRTPGKIKEQIDLAKKYGIYGFQFYYYWFSGKKVMDMPLNTFINNKDWDFRFSICWANENWTKRWDGRDNDVIFAQKYLNSDPLDFIKEVGDILNDSRYITEDEKPLLTVYRASELKNPAEYAKIWRDYFRKKYNKELYLVSCISFDDSDPREYGFDAVMDFAPLSTFFKTETFNKGLPFLSVDDKLLDVNYSGQVIDYRKVALNKNADNCYDWPTLPCVTPSWSNEARKKGSGVTFQNSTPDLYSAWLDRLLDNEIHHKQKKSPIIYINAWNEWAEGAMMEPSQHLGHSTLIRTAEILAKYSESRKNVEQFAPSGIMTQKNVKMAVFVHLFYPDLWDGICKKLKNINEPFDLFVSVQSIHRDINIEKIGKHHKNTNIIIVPNRGRDVLPFLMILQRIRKYKKYDYLLKIHTKKSKHRDDGEEWFSELLNGLIPDDTTSIMKTLTKGDTGAIGPSEQLVSLKRHMGSNKNNIGKILKMFCEKDFIKKVLHHTEKYPFFGGTMFWCRMDLLEPLLDAYLTPSDFQSEQGQVDGTTAHAIERILGAVLHDITNKTMYEISSGKIKKVIKKSYDEKFKYAE